MSGVRSSGTGLTCGGYTISGQVLTSTGNPLSGVSIKTTSGLMVATDASGNYTLSNIPNGSYTLYAEKSGYTFSPVALDVSLSGANLSNQNFTGTAIKSFMSCSSAVEISRSECEALVALKAVSYTHLTLPTKA